MCVCIIFLSRFNFKPRHARACSNVVAGKFAAVLNNNYVARQANSCSDMNSGSGFESEPSIEVLRDAPATEADPYDCWTDVSGGKCQWKRPQHSKPIVYDGGRARRRGEKKKRRVTPSSSCSTPTVVTQSLLEEHFTRQPLLPVSDSARTQLLCLPFLGLQFATPPN